METIKNIRRKEITDLIESLSLHRLTMTHPSRIEIHGGRSRKGFLAVKTKKLLGKGDDYYVGIYTTFYNGIAWNYQVYGEEAKEIFEETERTCERAQRDFD